METKHLDFSLQEKAAATSADSVGSWVISSDDYDRVNDRITTPALKSLVGQDVICLWQHNPDQPIGVWKNLRMMGNKLAADLTLAETNLGKMIKELLSVGTPLAASVGFKGLGKKNEKNGIDFSQISLLETSIVSIPANAAAMRIAKNFGITLQSSEGDPDLVASDRNPETVVDRAKAAILSANRTLRK